MFRIILMSTLALVTANGAVAQMAPGIFTAQPRLETGAPIDSETADFITKAAEGGRFAIQASELALERSTSPALRDFAASMIEEHSEAATKLAAAARQAATDLPDSGVSKLHLDIIAQLRQRAEAEFDEAFTATQIAAHQDAVALFGNYVKQGRNAQIKDHAAAMLPVLQHHLEFAEELQRTVSGDATAGKGSGSADPSTSRHQPR